MPLAAILEWLSPWIARFFVAKLAWAVAKFFGVLGIAMATNAYLVEPLLDHIESAWGAMPAQATQWVQFFGLNQVVSILLSAYAINGVSRVFFRKSS